MDKVIVITGPTAVGKTKLSISIAKKFNTELINADAYQVYKKMNIGTAKPTIEEQDNVVHHLLDYLDPSEEFSISDYQKIVRLVIDKMNKENKLPILVGGSGLYIDSVINEYHFDEEKRVETDEFDNLSNEELHKVLEDLDYEASQKIHQNNRKRVLRAIELAKYPDNKNSRSQRDVPYYDTLCIFLSDDREKLYDRINKRVDVMIANGLIDEIKNIGLDNFSKTSKVAIGYKEIIEYLNGNISLEEAVELIKKNSRHYAKRQFTWFNNKTKSIIVNVNVDDFNQTISEVENIILDWINK